MRGTIVVTLFGLALAACGDDGPAPRPPQAGDALLATDEDTPVSHEIQAIDPTGGDLTLMAQAPSHGTVTVDRLRITYTPDANYHGPDTFLVTVSNGVLGASARVDVTVRSVNDAPAAAADAFAAAEDTPFVQTYAALLANDTDPDGDPLAVTAVSSPTHGTVSMGATGITFTPAANHDGPASFEYTVTDGTTTATATVTLDVGGTNDPPVATDDTADVQEDTPLAIEGSTLAGNDTDLESQTLTVTAVANPTNGAVVLAGGTVTFTPDPDFNGTASFDYTVSDGAATDSGHVTIDVGAVNDAPVAIDDISSTAEGTALQLASSVLLANDTDVDGPALAVIAVQDPVNGTVSLGATTVTFTPLPGFTGAASFDYVVGDGTLTDVGTVAITVTAAPVCGDGAIVPPEACDDGDADPGDGCSATCQTEPGWTCTGAPSTCQRQRLAIFTFTGAAGNEAMFPADAPLAPGLASQPVMSRGPGLDEAAAPNMFSSELWNVAPAIDLTDYYAFTVTPAPGFDLTLLGIELDERRSLSGPLNWAVRSSLDNFTTNLATFVLPDNDLFRVNQLVLLGPAFGNLTVPVELRIYGWDSEASLGTWRLDNVEIFGFTTGP